ncbi:hypothetical protein Acr_27g0002650 [Actinidia rufa]|uniref:Uncharacterized protein n=1 Tax=Actinidia rufa TaxID=165716 RepID=A0A7J0H613_9ERIC|nr:hypothetical protein Acr_00g0002660 [Actinidia rufa]GFS28829.1 hypothetical protein Acr_00g0004160 [Actinidia rufa]GFZ18526.1 hypothetical protein Acr_27g0002650 [Actinidia rufa]
MGRIGKQKRVGYPLSGEDLSIIGTSAKSIPKEGRRQGGFDRNLSGKEWSQGMTYLPIEKLPSKELSQKECSSRISSSFPIKRKKSGLKLQKLKEKKSN